MTEIFGIVREFRREQAPVDPREVKRWAEEQRPPVHYLTRFEVVRVEEVQDELLQKADRPYLSVFFRPKLPLPILKLDPDYTFQVGVWGSALAPLETLFPIRGSEYTGFHDERVGESGWRSKLDGTLYASLEAALAARVNEYSGETVIDVLE